MTNRIPKSIQAILERAEDLQDQAAQQRDIEEEEKADNVKLQMDQEWSLLWSECGPQLPKEIRRFARKPEVEINFHLDWSERAIPIGIPGLAPFIAIFDGIGQGEERHLELGGYRCPILICTSYVWHWRGGYEEHLNDNAHALENVLLRARDLMGEFQGEQRHEEEQRALDGTRAAERQQCQAQEKAEEELLVEEIKKDPVAALLLKALILVQQERSGFMAEIENANFAAESIESRLSEKLASVRRQADEAKNEAEDERRRKEDLQDELDKVEKKSKRGW